MTESTKPCRECGVEKGLSEFFLHAKSPDGHRHVCKVCVDVSQRPTKVCNMCHEEKPVSEFHRSNKSPDGRQYRCKACASAYAQRWAKEHPDRHLENMRRYMRNEVGKQTRRAYVAQNRQRINWQRRTDWYARNREALNAKERERRATDPEWRAMANERARRYRDNNRHRRLAYHLRCQYGLAWDDFQAMIVAQLGRCAICGDQCDLHVDHCHDGMFVRGLLCARCNNGLGHFRDNPEFLLAAVEYLRRAQSLGGT